MVKSLADDELRNAATEGLKGDGREGTEGSKQKEERGELELGDGRERRGGLFIALLSLA